MLEIQAALQLAQLPRPLDPEGKTLFNSVYGVSASKKVKRYEIVAAIDGEAVNLYDVQSARLIASYPVPPHSSFPCPPCSIRLRKDGESSAMRHTYCVSQGSETQLQCFSENDVERGISKGTSTVFSLNDSQSPVVFLETVPVYQNPGALLSCEILVIHQDGTIRRIASDLSRQKWSMKVSNLSTGSTSDLIVTGAHWMSGDQAEKTVLKNRPDLRMGRDFEDSGFLVLIAKRAVVSVERKQDMIYGLWSLTGQPLLNDFANSGGLRASPLILQTLPDTEVWGKNEAARYNFNPLTGTLSVAFSKGLITYDLCTYTPEVTSKLFLDATATSYPLRLTSSLAVGSTPTAVTVYDTKYQSIQSTVDLEKIGSRRKRKRGGNTSRSAVQFITYFAKIRRLVALRGYTLIAFDITTTGAQSGHNSSYSDRMLIEAIGRGIPSARLRNMEISEASYLTFGTLSEPNDDINSNWSSQQHRLDELAKNDDITAFEELMAKELCKGSDSSKLMDHAGLELPHPSAFINQSKVDYLISKIFEVASDTDVAVDEPADLGHDLKMHLRTMRLIHWLFLAGKCADGPVERALQRKKSSQAFAVRPGAVTRALIRCQKSYEVIIDYLRHSPLLSLPEILQAIKLLLEDVVADATKSLPATLRQEGDLELATSSSENAISTDQGDDDGSIQRYAPASEMQAGNTMTPNPSSLALLLALERLGFHSSKEITDGMRSQLSQSEILSTIQVLRQQLFHSGHTSYLPTPPLPAPSSPKLAKTDSERASLNLDAILRLLSSCLDAVGPVGFLAPSANDTFLERLVPDLKSEISFAFQGMQETNHLQGLLREVIRYADSVQSMKDSHVPKYPLQADFEGEQKPGTIVTLYTEAKVEQGDVEGHGGLLPLSLRASNAISGIKARKGGGQVARRSRRDLLRLQDRNVGKYSFERLVL